MILGETSLSAADRLYLRFSERFERGFIGQPEQGTRSIGETLDRGWELLRPLPTSELKRVKPEQIAKYLQRE